MANFSLPLPTFLEARLTPSERSAPSPSRWAIFSMSCKRRFHIAELEVQPIGILLGEDTFFVAFHRPTNGIAGADGVNTQVVAQQVRLRHRLDVINPQVGTHQADGLVFRAFNVTVVFLVAAVLPAWRRAAKAALVGDDDLLAHHRAVEILAHLRRNRR